MADTVSVNLATLRKKLRKYPGLNTPLGIPEYPGLNTSGISGEEREIPQHAKMVPEMVPEIPRWKYPVGNTPLEIPRWKYPVGITNCGE
jgi:hypothetical protein